MVEYPTMGNALLYETKQIAVKWEKLILINRQNQKEHSLIIIWA